MGAFDIDEVLLRTTLDEMVEGLQIITREWRYLYLNRAALAHSFSTKEKLIGNTMMHCYPGIENTAVFRHLEYVMKTRETRRFETEFEYPDGRKLWYEVHVEPHHEGILIRSIDIGERKKLEEHLAQAQKLEAVGRLAGGVAHDLNNMLGTMLVHCEMAMERTGETNPDTKRSLSRIHESVRQAASLTRHLLSFGRKQMLELKVVHLNPFIEDFRETLVRHLGKGIQVNFSLGQELKPIHVDPSQLEQILFNLCNNAKDAMPKGGTISIETSIAHLDEEYARHRPDVAPGDYVMLVISDTGHGMSKDTLARLFEPFFTTKPRGKGTGLGLAAVHGVVKQSTGHILVESEPGRGTTFKLYFPVVAQSKTPDSPPRPRRKKLNSSSNETILLVEDDGLLREAYSKGLRDAGYTVLAAESAEQARELFTKHKDDIDLLLTDIVLPGDDGHKLATSLLSECEDLNVVFMSGYAEKSILSEGLVATNSVLITKPMPMKTLLSTLRDVLDGKPLTGIIGG